jgi:hypothetical protein
MPSPADLFLRSVGSLIRERVQTIKELDENFHNELSNLVVNSKLTPQSFSGLQKQFKELLKLDLSVQPTIILSNNTSISLYQLYFVRPFNLMKISKYRNPVKPYTGEDVELIVLSRKIQDDKFAATFKKYKDILLEDIKTKKDANAKVAGKRKNDDILGLSKKKKKKTSGGVKQAAVKVKGTDKIAGSCGSKSKEKWTSWKMPDQNDRSVIVDHWAEYTAPESVFPHAKMNHSMQYLMSTDTRAGVEVPRDELKAWQSFLACQSTVFELAQRILTDKNKSNVDRVTQLLVFHYQNLVKKRFPSNLTQIFREEVSSKGNQYYYL